MKKLIAEKETLISIQDGVVRIGQPRNEASENYDMFITFSLHRAQEVIDSIEGLLKAEKEESAIKKGGA